MQKPYFSIIIPCLNEEKYLPKLLSNLVKQTFQNFEVIVVDGKSQDKTKVKALGFSDKLNIQVVTTDKRNVPYQRNLGAKLAQGKYLIFFDADSQIPKNFLEKIKYAFHKNHAQIVNAWVRPDSRNDKDKAVATTINFFFEITKLLGAPGIFGAFTAFEKQAFAKVGGYDQTLKFGEDSEIVKRAVKKGYKYVISKNTYYVYSLRRFRKEGTLNTLRNTTLLNLSNWIKSEKLSGLIDYPMGGHIFKG